MPQYKCPNCHKLFEWPSDACPHCNMRITLAPAKAKPLYCSECGAELYEGKQFCPSCGSDQSLKETKHVEVAEVSNNNDVGGHVPLILGVIAINISAYALYMFYIFGFMAIGSFILGLVSTILGAIRCRRSGAAKTGMILGIVSMGLSLIAMLLFAGVVVAIVMLLTRVL